MNASSNILFCSDPLALAFVSIIGVALVIFSLSQKWSIIQKGRKLEEEIRGRTKFGDREIRNLQTIRYFAKLLSIIDGVGFLYFVSIFCFILIRSKALETRQSTWIYVSVANLAYFSLLVPTFIIGTYYIYFRLFRYRFN